MKGLDIREQVITPEQAKRLKELGVPQVSVFAHVSELQNVASGVGYGKHYVDWNEYSGHDAAFTISEMVDRIKYSCSFPYWAPLVGKWIVRHETGNQQFENFAEACGFVLIDRVERGEIKFKKASDQ